LIEYVVLQANEAQYYIDKEDEYFNSVTPYYLSCFLKKPYTLEHFKKTLRKSCRNSSSFFNLEVAQHAHNINQRLEYLGLNFDLKIYIIPTDGSDNIGMPYTKDKAIIVPNHGLKPHNEANYGLGYSLFAHETYHVLSRIYPELRKSVYESLGFINKNYNLIPDGYREKLFINPDVVDYNHCIQLYKGNTPYFASPFLYKRVGNACAAIYDKDFIYKGVSKLNSLTGYRDLFKNTGYNNHPEELAAEHFRLLICNNSVQDQLMIDQFYNALLKNSS
jgi:hypothetical protein